MSILFYLIVLSTILSIVFFLFSTTIAMLIIYPLTETDNLITGTLSAAILFMIICCIFHSQIPLKEDYERMKAELHQIKEAAVKAGIGHYKEIVVETKKEFVIGTFTAEVE